MWAQWLMPFPGPENTAPYPWHALRRKRWSSPLLRLPPMRFFITGGTGFIGGHVARLLRQGGHEVTAIARDPSKATDLTTIGIDVRSGDVTNKESMRESMEGADGVFHIAGWYKV